MLVVTVPIVPSLDCNMENSAMNIRTLAISLMTLGLLLAGTAKATDFDSIVVFGDSLSDPGNYFHLFGEQSVQPFEPDNIPSAPYAAGGHHFSNGETWIELLSRRLGMAPSGSPALVAPGVFQNYAVGRSRARDDLLDLVFHEENLTSQVDRFIGDGVLPENALYVVWIGSNDLADALGAYLSNNTGLGNDIISASIANTATQIGRLYQAGARRVLVPNIPDFAISPRLLQLAAQSCAQSPAPDICEAQVLGQVSIIVAGYNGALAYALMGIDQLPGMEVIPLDVAGFLTNVVQAPELYGFHNVEEACIAAGTRQRVFCPRPNTYLFWDGQHPTRKGHRALADFALQTLSTH